MANGRRAEMTNYKEIKGNEMRLKQYENPSNYDEKYYKKQRKLNQN